MNLAHAPHLLGDNSGKAHQAIWTLIDAPQASLSFLAERLRPVAIADQTKIQQWISDLNNENFAVRQTATKELEKVGPQVEFPIQRALQGNLPLETRRRLEQIVKNLPDVPDPDTVRLIRAIMVLERIGSAEARRVLESLARGAPGARETEEAKSSLIRLARQTLASR